MFFISSLSVSDNGKPAVNNAFNSVKSKMPFSVKSSTASTKESTLPFKESIISLPKIVEKSSKNLTKFGSLNIAFISLSILTRVLETFLKCPLCISLRVSFCSFVMSSVLLT